MDCWFAKLPQLEKYRIPGKIFSFQYYIPALTEAYNYSVQIPIINRYFKNINPAESEVFGPDSLKILFFLCISIQPIEWWTADPRRRYPAKCSHQLATFRDFLYGLNAYPKH